MASQEYIKALELAAEIYGTSTVELERVLTEVGAPYTAETVEDLWLSTGSIAGSDLHVVNTASGKPLFYTAKSRGTITNSVNSNVSKTGSITYPVNTTVAEPVPSARISFKAGMREAGKFTIGEVVPAVAATGLGITLGKTIDSALYRANPEFWDAHGMSALNPETWNSITSGNDGISGTLFNLVFGLDADTGETQAYIDEDAAAYLAWYMKTRNLFGGERAALPAVGQSIDGATLVGNSREMAISMGYDGRNSQYNRWLDAAPYGFYGVGDAYSSELVLETSRTPLNTFTQTVTKIESDIAVLSGNLITGSDHYTVFKVSPTSEFTQVGVGKSMTRSRIINKVYSPESSILITPLLPAVDGVGNQDDAQIPNTDNWTDLNSTKQSLQNQYPDLWNNAKHYDYVNPDGSTTSRTYIPINLPNTNNKNDSTPTTGDRTQSDPQVNPESPSPLVELITEIITQLTPDNPPPTGEGDSPVVPAPTGSASSLWAVYNPTQAQVDSFGAWLWSSDLVEQIKKLFNDPMQAIIGIHKVFATPSTGAAQNIKCGYIDSGVPAAVVTNQYTTVNCGTVNLREFFGNVFDYSPFTEVSLYLPFIGIVKLDVSDVMRASITVKYHVDVITGACLADVIVNRDAAGGVLYQYSGSAIVTYPISSGSYASAMAGVLSIAGGLIGTALTGGAAAPALLGAAVGASHLHSDIQKSGSFSGAAGAMGAKVPYLIISRPQTAMPSSYKHLEGQPTNYYTKLSSASGYVKVKAVQVKGIDATDTELDMIDAALRQGVEL